MTWQNVVGKKRRFIIAILKIRYKVVGKFAVNVTETGLVNHSDAAKNVVGDLDK